jgi:hypothetical protein
MPAKAGIQNAPSCRVDEGLSFRNFRIAEISGIHFVLDFDIRILDLFSA